MSANNKDVAVRKRQQIDSSRKTMFIFVAGAAFLAGIALVISIFLIQQIVFHSKVIIEKQSTIFRLDKNLESVDELKKNVRVLETNSALNSVKANSENSALQTVLDALPDNPNADAFGASIKNKFVDTVEGLTLDNLSVTSPNSRGEESEDNNSESADSPNTLHFSLEVSGSADKLRELLTKFERSIRVIELKSFEIHTSEDKLSLTIQGVAYYEPAQKIHLEKKVVKP
mgnify:FL=1|jgi:hypothetical protein cdiviTM7_02679